MIHELTVERLFAAAHAITMRGVREVMHGHHWTVRATVAGDRLDADGLLCDFHLIEAALDGIVARFHNRTLNDTPPFDVVNPTAEHVALHVAEEIARALPPGVRLVSASVTEAPGCTATVRPAS
ncbi:MAG: 6-carboxytetrahydropterin synthase [Phycisphaerales bacterium]|nr:6-carboxytetrahydropterin synthase [Phycisphaerales bacterium]